MSEHETFAKMAKRSKDNAKQSIFDLDTETPECRKSAFVQPDNSPANCCEFQSNEETVGLQSPISDNVGDKHDQPLTNEINFDDQTTCNKELHQQKSSQENMKNFL